MAHILGKPHFSSVNPALKLSLAQATAFRRLAQRRLSHEPIQHIMQSWDFRQLKDLTVLAPLLVPRPETETLVDLALFSVESESFNPPLVLDIGAGTGAAGLALAAAAVSEKHHPRAALIAVDNNATACAATLMNAKKLGMSVEVVHAPGMGRAARAAARAALREAFADAADGHGTPRNARVCVAIVQGDIMRKSTQKAVAGAADLFSPADGFAGGAPLVVCNPPYITAAEADDLDETVLGHEDPLALFGDLQSGALVSGVGPEDGLSFTRALLRNALPGIGASVADTDPQRHMRATKLFLELGGAEQVTQIRREAAAWGRLDAEQGNESSSRISNLGCHRDLQQEIRFLEADLLWNGGAEDEAGGDAGSGEPRD